MNIKKIALWLVLGVANFVVTVPAFADCVQTSSVGELRATELLNVAGRHPEIVMSPTQVVDVATDEPAIFASRPVVALMRFDTEEGLPTVTLVAISRQSDGKVLLRQLVAEQTVITTGTRVVTPTGTRLGTLGDPGAVIGGSVGLVRI